MGTRDRMLDAAAHVMRTRGLARATTKEIAKEAGYSEAALYKHFRDKTDLFLGVLQERVPSNLRSLLAGLADRAGRGALRETLTEVAAEAIEFYTETFPIAASLFSEPTLLAAHRNALRDRNMGPQVVRDELAAYLAAEQRAGAIAPEADPEAAAALLLGACLQNAFLTHFTETPNPTPQTLATTVLDGLGVPK
ncbi:TetR/AcrR family transcriptional regulator [Saccharopolyspora sp. K220]|uniref:TetR/AcrR family transcriptional regulator n=1 Tax=Saccharopolyspora soli TaxID=2926618 RepID=UPI001F576E01|nr:TetR/AcrR family transcriptional regulator [Saccharopolyspora soli]MCI2423714.1 TetR/AcrR family transcriptional regulator [Saccharopolyspora soli]